jgi:hypothetical protein
MDTYGVGFVVSDDTYKDNIRSHPYHFNAMRHKPINPSTYIDTNISQLKSFPDKWKSFNEPNNVSDKGRPHLAKRCLFYDGSTGQHVHMSTLDTLGTRHMLDENINFPEEDYILNTIGRRREVADKRNEIGEKSSGDKPYKAVEYSQLYFNKINRNWRYEKHEPVKNTSNQTASEELFKLLGLKSDTAGLFKPTHDLNYEHHAEWERNYEINNVKSLDNWKPAAKLDLPFKVLDNPDKNFKYRPKVTK